MGAALAANTSGHIGGIGSVVDVVSAGCRQGGLQLLRPLLVGPGQPPHLIGTQAKIAERRPERLATVHRVEELLAYFDRQPLLRPGPSASSLVVGMRPGAEVAVTAAVPARRGAVLHRGHRPYPSDGSPITGHSLLTTQAQCPRLGKVGLSRDKRRRHLRENDRFPPMTARGRLLSGLVAMVIALAGFVTVGAPTVAAGPTGTLQYVALGDSYAAGIGAPPYRSVSLGDKICVQSINMGYPGLLDLEKDITLQVNGNATCPGATTTDVAALVASPLNPLDEDTRLVTLTVGGNDLGFGDLAGRVLLLRQERPVPNCNRQRSHRRAVDRPRQRSHAPVWRRGKCGA